MHKVAEEMRDLGRKRAEEMRGRARERAMRRKEEYLGARVPRALKEKVIAQASRMGIPVSILIRNILEEAFAGSDAAAAGEEEARTQRDGGSVDAERFPNVIGWERIVLNRAMECTQCGRMLAAGTVVTHGLPVDGSDHVILCDKCK